MSEKVRSDIEQKVLDVEAVIGSQLVVAMQDVMECLLCARGARRFFEARGRNFRDFVTHGMPLITMAAWNDGTSNAVVEHVLTKVMLEHSLASAENPA